MGEKCSRLSSKLKLLKKDLKALNDAQFGHVSVKHDRAYKNMINCQNEVQQQPSDIDLRNKEQEARKEYSLAHQQYITFLNQKAKIRWLIEGSDNTQNLSSEY